MKNPSCLVTVVESLRDDSVGHLVVRARYIYGCDEYALLDAASSLRAYARAGRKLRLDVRVDPLEVTWFKGDVPVRNYEIELVGGRVRD